MKYINVYEVSSEYGGPEEGGWWYNYYEPIKSIPVRGSKSRKIKSTFRKACKEYFRDGTVGKILGSYLHDYIWMQDDCDENDMYGVKTETKVEVLIESLPARSSPRPTYC
jgi:hypothetical protein